MNGSISLTRSRVQAGPLSPTDVQQRSSTRREALSGLALLATSGLLQGQEVVPEPSGRIAPREDLVNVFEAEAMAQRKLSEAEYAAIAGSDRSAFERITFRPRLLVNARQLDLSTELFGEKMFAPILVGPASRQRRAHPEGELATARGASAAKTAMVVSSRSSYPIEEIAALAKTSLWYQVYPEQDMTAVRTRAQQAVKAGCKVLCLTVGAPYGGTIHPSRLQAIANPGMDWRVVDRLRQEIGVPLLLKGIMSPEEARTAVQRGVEGIVVSNHGGRFVTGLEAPMEMLPSIVDAVGGKTTVLIDGSFRRGTDILKALALGARAVMVARPPLWGLAAYGADGVQTVLEILQTGLARSMAMCGTPNLKSINRSFVKIHRR